MDDPSDEVLEEDPKVLRGMVAASQPRAKSVPCSVGGMRPTKVRVSPMAFSKRCSYRQGTAGATIPGVQTPEMKMWNCGWTRLTNSYPIRVWIFARVANGSQSDHYSSKRRRSLHSSRRERKRRI